jgi:sugar lactone lactonase YvrE
MAALVLGLPGTLRAEPKYISTLCGNGVAGFNGDGLPARSTALYLPQDGVFGPDGTFYFLDWNNHRVRHVRADGTVEGIAGNGAIGDAKDGPALSISLNHPTHVSFDHQGNLILSAWHNSKVKLINLTTGLASNIAGTGARAYGGDGGPALDAKFDLPSSAVMDSQGNICVSDQANFRIRRIGTDGNINTMCGSGVAGYTGDEGPATLATIRSPVGQSAPPAGRIDIDSQDRIFIADTGNHVIRRIDADGTIHTIAGTGVAGYSGDGGPANQATLNTPSDVAVAPDGTLYIADTFNNVVRRVTTDGTISTIAGTGSAGFSGDGRLAQDAKLDRPYGVAISPTGEIMIADTHNHRFRILTEEPRDSGPDGGEPAIVIVPCTGEIGSICTYAGTGFPGFNSDGRDRQKTHLYQPIDMEFTPSGRVYVIDWNNHKVRQVMPDQTIRTVMGTDFVGDGPPDLSDLTPPGAPGLTVDLNHPTDLQEFPNGDLMVMNWHNHKIRVLYPDTGLVQVIAGSSPGFVGDNGPVKAAKFNQPPHGVLDSSDNLIMIDQRNQRLRVILDFANQRENATIITIAGDPGVPAPGTLPAPGYNGDGPALQTKFSFPTGTNPEPGGGLAVAADGTVYLSDTNNHLLRKITFTGGDWSTGVVQTIAGTGVAGDSGDGGPAIAAQINHPLDMELGPDGKLYFADTNNNRVRRLDLVNGTIEAVAGTGVQGYSGDGGPALAATFNRPLGIAFDPYGNLYISDTFNNRIRKVKLTTTQEGPEPILPADYQASFVEVRNCRFSFEHGGVYIRVLTDPGSAELYQANASLLPVGSVVVKEEYSSGDCGTGDLVRWRAMRKEAPGYDPEDGDWHWQMLTPRREVAQDTKATCIGCHRQIDCVRRDYMCTLAGNNGMKIVLDSLPAPLLAISGTAPQDGHNHGHTVNFEIFGVGADPRDGRGPLVVRFDGGKWHRLLTRQQGDLWWISDREIEGSFYMCGENGMILRFDEQELSFERQATPGGKLLYGVWGTDKQHLWAVGGDPADEDHGGAIWKWNGVQWIVDPDAPADLPTLFKVWGRSATEVYAVGRLGLVLNWNGVRWTTMPTGIVRPLFTVHGDSTRVIATGGAFSGVILELGNGEVFADRAPAGAPQMNGIFVTEGGPTAAVGNEGTYAVRGASGWELKPQVTAAKPFDFHATWMDTAGGVWAVGGNLSGDFTYGVLAYAGSAGIGREFESDAPCPTGVTGPRGTVSYTRDISPLFKLMSCQNSTCHTGVAPASEFDTRDYEALFGPGQEARNFGMCNIVPGNPDASFLLEKLGPNPRAGLRMPNGFPPLSQTQMSLIRTWILEGAIKDTQRDFSRGNLNGDAKFDLSDPVALLGYLFLGTAEPACLDAADVDDNGILGLTDSIYSLNFLFIGGPAPLAPFPVCGQDPTASDDLTCDSTRCQ